MPASTGLRARVRAELTAEIKHQARLQLADDGAPGVSLRAITRSMGMASSAIYRYFPSRDELLTALIIDAYDSLGASAEATVAQSGPREFVRRWKLAGLAIRSWATAHPHEYALLYGSPVPGYRAPEDTIGPAGRVTAVLAAIVTDAAVAGAIRAPEGAVPPLTAAARHEADRLVDVAFPGVDGRVVLRAVVAWTQLFGMISFERFGHFEGVVVDRDAVFDQALMEMAAFIGIDGGPGDAP
jgi:AcrR family transcriptional regulator